MSNLRLLRWYILLFVNKYTILYNKEIEKSF